MAAAMNGKTPANFRNPDAIPIFDKEARLRRKAGCFVIVEKGFGSIANRPPAHGTNPTSRPRSHRKHG